MTRREIDVGTPKLSVDFENNICTVLALRICNVF